ncbi:hypothetical protein DFP73DRAFT_580551 [Morchella snyderi]|nr:hypothetical protein DFP73DRAFT_580551 [Morchella snyderi]
MSATPLPPLDTSQTKGHVRNTSSADERRVAVPRRRTKGPLDFEENPLPKMSDLLSPTSPTTTTPTPLSPSLSPSPSPIPIPIPIAPAKDHTFLRHPPLFHPLPPTLLPTPYHALPAPPPTTPLPSLIASGHLRSAAIAAATTLADHTVPLAPAEIYNLWYIRLATLTLLSLTPTAAQEVRALSDLNSSFYKDPATGHCLLPWELRVLAVRLQAVAYGDWRRAVAMYYELGREARGAVVAAAGEETVGVGVGAGVWRERLAELGVRVGSALVEMGDVGGAARHLAGLRGGGEGVVVARALLWVRVGNVDAARGCLAELEEGEGEGGERAAARGVLGALLVMADGRWGEAVEAWRALQGVEGVGEVCRRCNEAVCLLYTGRLEEARGVLEDLVDEGKVAAGGVFNLATVYELCSDASKGLKMRLAERVAGLGVEMVGASFKM